MKGARSSVHASGKQSVTVLHLNASSSLPKPWLLLSVSSGRHDKEGFPAEKGGLVQGQVLKNGILQSGKIQTQETEVKFLKLSREGKRPCLWDRRE